MKFESTGITSIILALSLVLTTPLSIGAYGIAETKVSGLARESIQDGSQNKDSPQFVMILWRKPGPRAANPIGNPKWPGETSTGGKNWVGYMVSEFNHTLTLAYGFASSGAVVDPHLVKPNPYYAYCFQDQIRHFNMSIGHRPDYALWNVDNAVAAIWFGVNDVRLSFTENGTKKLMKATVKRLFELTHELHKLGLRQFVFLEVPPLEFLPIFQPRKPGKKYVTLTYAIRVWNDHLVEHIERFRQDHPNSKASVVQIWDIYMNAMLDPASFGSRNNHCTDRRGDKFMV
ncbi:hypothetical protein LRP88_01680 [Fusarium phalaenopsidis]